MYCKGTMNPGINWDEYESEGFNAMAKRYSTLLDAIGTARLLELPDDVREALMKTRSLSRKIELLELVAKSYGIEV